MRRTDFDPVRRAMALSRVDALMFAVMVGCGEAYFLADGVRLGATTAELGLLVGLPYFVGALGPLVTVLLLAKWRRRKPVVVLSAASQAVVLSALAVLTALGRLTPALLIVFACVYQVFGQAAGVAWSSWYGDAVPSRLRGRYFASRSGWAHLVTSAAVVGAGLCLQFLEPGAAGDVAPGLGGAGYVIIYGIASAARLLSSALLAASPEPRSAPLARLATLRSTLKTPNGRVMQRLVHSVAAMQFAVYVGAAYFTPFMLSELSFSYAEYTLASVSLVIIKFLAMKGWGRSIDRDGARVVYLRTTVLVALVPIPWMLAQGLGGVLAVQVFAGLAWGGYEVSQFTLLLEAANARLRPALLAGSNVVTGFAQLLGSLTGGLVAEAAGNDYRVVFGATFLGRLAAAFFVAPLVQKGSDLSPHPRVVLRILGIRPGGGLGHRPVVLDTAVDTPLPELYTDASDGAAASDRASASDRANASDGVGDSERTDDTDRRRR
ncbi:MAG: hypothetical protein IPK13_14065 [Deltaproteobacteria bacterium]|nr:hypothetical protein [Deltaproteobacteria bacterium]